MFQAPQESAPGPASQLFEAIGRKAWDDLERIASSDIAVEVRAHPGIRTTRNQHVWRAVSLRGRAALREYLMALNEAAPGLAVEPRTLARHGDHEVVRADCAGVDSAGSPFDAEADFAVWMDGDGMVRRLEASINGLAVGSDVIRRGEGDPRKYFRTFLD